MRHYEYHLTLHCFNRFIYKRLLFEIHKMLQIYTAVVNHPEWIELQLLTLKRFLTGDWQFVVLNDAKDFADFSNFGDVGMRYRIADTCARLNIPCIHLQNQHHQHITCAATRCYHALQQTLHVQQQQGGRVLGLDSDMFPMQSMDADTLYAGYTTAIVPQVRTNEVGKQLNYFWNGLYYFDFDRIGARANLMDWRCNDVAGVWTDVGGGMHTFLEQLDPAEMYRYEHKSSGSWGFDEYPFSSVTADWLPFCMGDPRNQGDRFFSEIYDNRFLHFRGGGAWERRNPTEYKQATDLLWSTVRTIID